MLSPDTLLTFVLASAVLAIAPGPDNIFVLAQSALHGRRAGLLITLGLCTGLIVHTLAVALGVAAVIQTSAVAFTVLKVAGAAYLLYLAWGALRAASSQTTAGGDMRLTAWALYRRGIIMNISNPKVAIFFLAFLPQFADPAQGAVTQQLLLLGGLFILVAWILFSLIAVLSGYLNHWLRQSPGAQPALHRLAALVFVGLAAKLAFSER